MNPELEQKLADRFSFMRHREHTNQNPYKAFGCECGDGWFQILWDLCSEIEQIYKNYSSVPDIQIVQIKEKTGGLRFYFGYDWNFDYDIKSVSKAELDEFYERIYNVVGKYEVKSEETCERCGAPGKCRSNGGWVSTLCDKCRNESG